jgi:hypothetical protein
VQSQQEAKNRAAAFGGSIVPGTTAQPQTGRTGAGGGGAGGGRPPGGP